MALMSPSSENQLAQARMAAMAPSVIQNPMHALTAPLGAPPDITPNVAAGMSMDQNPPIMSAEQPKVKGPSQADLRARSLNSRLMTDYARDADPWGSPDNHPGFMGKLGHGLSRVVQNAQHEEGHLTPHEAEEQRLEGQVRPLEQQIANQNVAEQNAESEGRLRGAQSREANARADALENPPEKDTGWKPLFGANGQVVTAGNGQIVETDKDGNLRLNALPQGATVAPKETPDHSAFAEWQKNPQSFEAFQKFMHSFASSHGAGFSPYAAILALRTAYQDNPALTPVAAQMAVQAFGQAGIHLTPEQMSALSGIPEDQPLSQETGRPIGTAMPEAPTASIRTSAQGAQTLESMISDNILPALDAAEKAGDVGIGSGRMQDFLLRRIGDPASPAAKLQATLDAVGPMLGRMYGFHSAQYTRAYNDFLNTRMTPEALRAYLAGVTEHAETTQRMERGYGETQNRDGGGGDTLKIGATQQYNGKTYRFKGGDRYDQKNWEEVKK